MQSSACLCLSILCVHSWLHLALGNNMKNLGKIQITLKSPDGIDYAIQEYTQSMIDEIKAETKPHEDWEDELFRVRKLVKKKLAKFIQYSEYVTIEIDLDNETAKVL